jgi:hypothetical protein
MSPRGEKDFNAFSLNGKTAGRIGIDPKRVFT